MVANDCKGVVRVLVVVMGMSLGVRVWWHWWGTVDTWRREMTSTRPFPFPDRTTIPPSHIQTSTITWEELRGGTAKLPPLPSIVLRLGTVRH